LDYLTKTPVSKTFVAELAAQNPSLEVISVHLASPDGDDSEDVKGFLKEINHPRLRTITNLVKNSFQKRSYL